MLEMPVIRRTVFGAVLAHRRHDDAIEEGDAAEPQGFEEERASFHVLDRRATRLFVTEWRRPGARVAVSGLRLGPVVDPGEGLTHQPGTVGFGEPVGGDLGGPVEGANPRATRMVAFIGVHLSV